MRNMGVMNQDELQALRDALQFADQIKKSAIGQQTPAGLGDGIYSALVPQDLDQLMATLSFMMEDLVLYNDSPKGDANQPLHEYNRQTGWGNNRTSGFFGEGGLPSGGNGVYSRESELIRYIGQYDSSVTSVANATRTQGNMKLMAVAKRNSTVSCMGRTERAVINSNSNLSPMHFRGIKQQIEEGGGMVVDMGGSELDLGTLEGLMGELAAHPRYAKPTKIYAADRVKASLSRAQQPFGRRDMSGGGVVQGARDLSVICGTRQVPIDVAPFLDFRVKNEVAGFGENQPDAPTVDSITAATAADSKFTVNDAGTYKYAVVAFSEDGYSASTIPSAVLIEEGEAVTLVLDDAAAKADGAGKKKVLYYELFRSEKDGDDDTLLRIGEYPVNTDGGAGRTALVDKRERVYGTSDVLVMAMDKRFYEIVRLLPLVYNPLPQVGTTFPFLVMHFLTPIIKAPEHFALIKNVGIRGGYDIPTLPPLLKGL